MNLLAIPTRAVPAERLVPGDVIIHKALPWTVDEVRRSVDGVKVFGAPGTGDVSRRRVAIGFDDGAAVEVVPDESTRRAIRASVEAMVRTAAAADVASLSCGSTEPTGPFVPAYEIADGALLLRLRGTTYAVRFGSAYIVEEPAAMDVVAPEEGADS